MSNSEKHAASSNIFFVVLAFDDQQPQILITSHTTCICRHTALDCSKEAAVMEEGQEGLDQASLDFQVRDLRSGSTRLRIEVLRRILHLVEAAGGERPNTFGGLLVLITYLQTLPIPTVISCSLSLMSSQHILSTKIEPPAKLFKMFFERTYDAPLWPRSASKACPPSWPTSLRSQWLLQAMRSSYSNGAVWFKKNSQDNQFSSKHTLPRSTPLQQAVLTRSSIQMSEQAFVRVLW